jgi:hypothetical protein
MPVNANPGDYPPGHVPLALGDEARDAEGATFRPVRPDAAHPPVRMRLERRGPERF